MNRENENIIKRIENTRISLEPLRTEVFKQELREMLNKRYLEVSNGEYKHYKKKGFFNKFRFLQLCALSFVTAFLTLGLASSGLLNTSDGKLGAEIAYAEGNLEYATASDLWKEATLNTEVKEGMSLRIIGEGRVIVNLDDGSSIRFTNDSQITLSSLDPQNIIISNDQGEVYTRVVKAERSFEVMADGMSFRSLGTAYKTVNTAEKVGVEVYHSKVKVVDEQKKEDVVTVKEGEKYYVVNQKEPAIENIVVAVKTDDVKKDAFVQWNKEQDTQSFASELGILNNDVVAEEVEDASLIAPTNNVAESTLDSDVIATTESATLSLTGEVLSDGIMLSWADSEPLELAKYTLLFGDNPSIDISSSNVININDNSGKYFFKKTDGKTYNFRLCRIDGTGCALLSNVIALTTPLVLAAKPTGVVLTGVIDDTGVTFQWEVNNLEYTYGFILLKSSELNPSYDSAQTTYINDPSAINYYLNIRDGQTYHFRICIRGADGTCATYSNDLVITAPAAEITSISLSKVGSSQLSWNVTGIIPKGFVVTWSTVTNPTYPARATDKISYIEDSSTTSLGNLVAFNGTGTYFVRLCGYVSDGVCSVWSNEIKVEL